MAIGAGIKGITIQFNGDTTNLGKAMTDINNKAKGVDQSLREVNRALKFNPGNTELIAQKQTLLKQKIEQTKAQLQAFKAAQKNMDAQGVDKTSQEYMELKRRIIETESKLEHFQGELKKLDYARINAIGQSFQKAGQKMRTAGMYSTIAGGAMIMAGKKLLDLSSVQAQAENKLTEVYRTRMGATEGAAKSTMKLASAIQKEGVIGDEVTLSGAQQLATFAKYPSTVDKILPAMDNLLVQQKGYSATADDARNVANLMGKALQGQTGALSRVGITFTEAQAKVLKFGTEQQKAAMLSKIVTQNVGHMNKEFAKTDEGKIQQAKNALGDVGERLGKILLPALAKVANYVSANILPKVEKLISYIEAHPVIGKTAVAIAGFLVTAGPLLGLLGGIVSGVGKVMSGFTGLAGVIGKVGGAFSGLFSSLPGWAGPAVLAVGGLVAAAASWQGRLSAVRKEYEKNALARKNAILNAGAEAAVISRQKARLFELMAVEKKSAGQKAQIKMIVKDLNSKISGLNLKYNEEKNALNMSRQALEQKIAAMKKEAQAAAYQEAIKAAYKDRIKLESEVEKAEKRLADYTSKHGKDGSAQYRTLTNELNRHKDALNKCDGEIDKYAKSYSRLTGEASKTASKVGHVSNEFTKLKKRAGQGGYEFTEEFVKNMKAGIYKVPKTVSEMNRAVSFDKLMTKAKNAGVNVPENVKKKIEDGTYKVPRSVNDLQKLVHFDKMTERAKSAGEAVPEKISDKMDKGADKPKKSAEKVGDNMKSPISDAVDKIKGWFPIRLGKLVKFRLPNVAKRRYKGGKGVLGFDVTWADHAKGGIFRAPTLLPTANTIHRVGEAGPEALLPLSKLWDQMDRMAEKIGQNQNQPVNAVFNITVDGSKDPAAFARDLISSLKMEMRS